MSKITLCPSRAEGLTHPRTCNGRRSAMREQRINGKRRAVLGSAGLTPLSPADDHVNLSAAALGTDKPLAPIENGGARAVSLRHLGGVGLNLMLTSFAPDDQPDLGRSGGAKGHRGATIGLHIRTGGRNSKNDKGTF